MPSIGDRLGATGELIQKEFLLSQTTTFGVENLDMLSFPRVEAILLKESIASTRGYRQIIPSGLKNSNTREVVFFTITSYNIRIHYE